MAGDYGFVPGSTAPNNNAYGLPGESGGHLGEFSTGIAGNPANRASVLNQDPGDVRLNSQQFNSMVPRSVVQTSTLQSPLPSGIGMSETDKARMLPGGQPGRPVMLPSQNGSSLASYQKSLYMRLNGLDAQ